MLTNLAIRTHLKKKKKKYGSIIFLFSTKIILNKLMFTTDQNVQYV